MNIPPDLLRSIASLGSPETRRSMARATAIPRRQTPIGLAVTRVGSSTVSPNRHVVNRSRATAKTPTLKYSRDTIDSVNPAAYKNNTWKYYMYLTRDQIAFANTRNSQPFLIDRKTGARKPLPAARLGVTNGPLQGMHPRRESFHTWNAYQKRLMRDQKYKAGKSGYNMVVLNVNKKVQQYLNGNNSALNTIPTTRLIIWARTRNWMNANGELYVKLRGKWHRYGGGEVTKNNVKNNIRRMASLRNND